jgi:hypothetical protein
MLGATKDTGVLSDVWEVRVGSVKVGQLYT